MLSEILVFRRKELSYDFYFYLLIVRFAVSSTRNTRRNHGTRLVFCCCFCDVIVLDVTIIFKHLQEKLFQTNKVPNSQFKWFNTTFLCLFRVIYKKCFVDSRVIGTLSNHDDDGGENIARKMNLCSFKLTRVFLDSPNMSNVGDFSWS